MKKHHNNSHIGKSLPGLAHNSVQSIITTVGRHGDMQADMALERSCEFSILISRQQEVTETHFLPQGHTFLNKATPPNSSPSGPMEAIFIQTTTLCLCGCMARA